MQSVQAVGGRAGRFDARAGDTPAKHRVPTARRPLVHDSVPPAVAFWRRVAAAVAGEAWAEERRAVPGRPDLPPDVWISFTV